MIRGGEYPAYIVLSHARRSCFAGSFLLLLLSNGVFCELGALLAVGAEKGVIRFLARRCFESSILFPVSVMVVASWVAGVLYTRTLYCYLSVDHRQRL